MHDGKKQDEHNKKQKKFFESTKQMTEKIFPKKFVWLTRCNDFSS